MATIGIFLSCEEQSAKRLVDIAVKAEQAGFRDLWISDHFHPWIDAQGESVEGYASAFGPKAAESVGRYADGYINVAPSEDLLAAYREAGGRGPAHGGMKVCWGPDEAECVKTVHRLWPNEALGGELAQV